jgi:hypothetical protein
LNTALQINEFSEVIIVARLDQESTGCVRQSLGIHVTLFGRTFPLQSWLPACYVENVKDIRDFGMHPHLITVPAAD